VLRILVWQTMILTDEEVLNPELLVPILMQKPNLLRLPRSAKAYSRQVFVRLHSSYTLDLPHSNLEHVRKYKEKHASRLEHEGRTEHVSID